MSMRDITLGRYMYGTSLLHRLDPRTKLLSLLLIMAGLFAGNGWAALCIAVVFTGIACTLSGLSPGYLMRGLVPFKWLIIITVILNVIFVGGHIVIEAPLPYGGITREGLNTGAMYGARIMLLVLMASLLSLTTEPIILVDGVEKLLKPLAIIGVKPHEVALAMVITIRFIPTLIDEAVKIRKSHIARGLRTDAGIKTKLKSVTMLFLPLFHSAVRRAENLATAMECRLYRSDMKRTRYKESHMSLRDWTALVISGVFAACIVAV
ncbi:energy-coupling factor transporter transmembrane component T family protein [Candidatus Latescibacterota bacterium]